MRKEEKERGRKGDERRKKESSEGEEERGKIGEVQAMRGGRG